MSTRTLPLADPTAPEGAAFPPIAALSEASGVPGGVLADEEIVARIRAGESGLYELLMRRYNQRLYRVARSIVSDDAEAEDVTQETWVRAFTHLGQFASRARFSTWLTRIAVHEALARSRRARRRAADRFDEVDLERKAVDREAETTRGPEQQALDRELRAVLEAAIGNLAPIYRTVLLLREVEGCSTLEVADSLGVSESVVKVRLHRARAHLRRDLATRAGELLPRTFEFGFERCDRMVAAVLARLRALDGLGALPG